jgi:hypothetical protein
VTEPHGTLGTWIHLGTPTTLKRDLDFSGRGVIGTEKVGRVRTCHLELARLETVEDWINARRRTWERRLDQLGDVLAASEPTTGDLTQTKESPR